MESSSPTAMGPRRASTGGRRERTVPTTPRLRKSCDPCSLAKRRCDGQPQCSLCRKKGLTCVYGERQKSGPKGRKGTPSMPSQGGPRHQVMFPRRSGGGGGGGSSGGAGGGFDDEAEGFDVRPLSSKGGIPPGSAAIASGGGGIGGGAGAGGRAGVGSSGEPMPTTWVGRDGGGGGGHGGGYYLHDSRRSTSLGPGGRGVGGLPGVSGSGSGGGGSGGGVGGSGSGSGSGGGGVGGGGDDRFHAYPRKYRRTAGAGWMARQPHAPGGGGGVGASGPPISATNDPPRYLESQLPMSDRPGDAVERRMASNDTNKNSGGPGNRESAGGGSGGKGPSPRRHWRAGGPGHVQRRAVSPSNVSRADVHLSPGPGAALVGAPPPQAENAPAGAPPRADPYANGAGGGDGGGRDWGPRQKHSAWKPTVGWHVRGGAPPPESSAAAGEDVAGEEVPTGGAVRGAAVTGPPPSSSRPPHAYSARNSPPSGGAPWDVQGGQPPPPPAAGGRWGEHEYYGGSGPSGAPPGYPRWGTAMMTDQHHLGPPPVSKWHLLPWRIEKIEEMEAMGAGRAGEDDEAWVRIATAMSSSISEAKDQWAAYCEMMRHQRWMNAGSGGSGGGGGGGSSNRAVMPPAAAAGPSVQPPWAAGEQHPAWHYRRADAAAAAAAGYTVGPATGAGVPTPEMAAYRATPAYGAPPGPMPATSGRRVPVVGRCSYCREVWNTDSPTAAVAIDAGRWCCPACESGTQPGPMPRHWEDDEGYIAMPRVMPGHHPFYSVEAAAASAAAAAAIAAGEPPLYGRAPPPMGGWPERGMPHSGTRAHGGGPSGPSTMWREEMEVRPGASPVLVGRPPAGRRFQDPTAPKSPDTVMGKPQQRQPSSARTEYEAAAAAAAASAEAAAAGGNNKRISHRASPSRSSPPSSAVGDRNVHHHHHHHQQHQQRRGGGGGGGGGGAYGQQPRPSSSSSSSASMVRVVTCGDDDVKANTGGSNGGGGRGTNGGGGGKGASAAPPTTRGLHINHGGGGVRGSNISPVPGSSDSSTSTNNKNASPGKREPARASRIAEDEEEGEGGGGGARASPPLPVPKREAATSPQISSPNKGSAGAAGLAENAIAKQSGERSTGDPLEGSGYTTDQAGTPTRDSQSTWTKEEDDKLLELVEAAAGHRGDSFRDIKWERISASFYARTAVQCESRWDEHVNPAVQDRRASSRRPSEAARAHSARQEATVSSTGIRGGTKDRNGTAVPADEDRLIVRGPPPEKNTHGAPRYWREDRAGRDASPDAHPHPRQGEQHAGAPSYVNEPNRRMEEASMARPTAAGGVVKGRPRGEETDWGQQRRQRPQHPQQHRFHHAQQQHQQQQQRLSHPSYQQHQRHHRMDGGGGGGGGAAVPVTQGLQQQQQQQHGRYLPAVPRSGSSSRASWGPHASPTTGPEGARRPWLVNGSGGGGEGRGGVHRHEDYSRYPQEPAPRGPRRMADTHARGPMVMMEGARGGGDASVRGGRGVSQPPPTPPTPVAAEEPYGWYVGGKNKGRGSTGGGGVAVSGREYAPPKEEDEAAAATVTAGSRRGGGEGGGRQGLPQPSSPPPSPPPQQRQQHADVDGRGGGGGGAATGARAKTAASNSAASPSSANGSVSPGRASERDGGGGSPTARRSPCRESPKTSSPITRGEEGARSGGEGEEEKEEEESPESNGRDPGRGGGGSSGGGNSSEPDSDSPSDKPGSPSSRRPQTKHSAEEEQLRDDNDDDDSGGESGPTQAKTPPPPQQQQVARKRRRAEEDGPTTAAAGGGGGRDESSFTRKKTAVDSLQTEGWTLRTAALGPSSRRDGGASSRTAKKTSSSSPSSPSSPAKSEPQQQPRKTGGGTAATGRRSSSPGTHGTAPDKKDGGKLSDAPSSGGAPAAKADVADSGAKSGADREASSGKPSSSTAVKREKQDSRPRRAQRA